MLQRSSLHFSRQFSSNIHPVAKVGFEKSGNQYDRGRPRYCKQITDTYFDKMRNEIGSNKKVIDIGAGTGIFTQNIIDYFPETNIMAIEPSSKFQEILHSRFDENSNISIYNGLASDLSFIESNTISAIFGGQVFHWFPHLNVLLEFERILDKSQRSHLFLIWNKQMWNNDFLIEIKNEVIDLYHSEKDKSKPKFERQKDEMEKMFSAKYISENALLFEPTKFDYFENSHKQTGGIDMIIDRILSKSSFASRSNEEKERVIEKIKDIVINHYNDVNAELFFPYSTYILHTNISK